MEIITPVEIDSIVRTFCESIIKNIEPVFLAYESEPDTEVQDCPNNVQKKINRDGGTYQNGWQINITEPFLIEAQFHMVWVDENKIMHDITPRQIPTMEKILFLPDSSLKYEDKQINNIRKSLVNDSLVNDFIEISDRYFEATNRGDLALNNVAINLDDITPEHAIEIKILSIEANRLLRAIYSKYGK